MKTETVTKWRFQLLLLVLLGWGIHWFLDNHRWETLETRVGVSVEARRNPWLAAERFLRRLNRSVESQSGRRLLLQPPAAGGVLIVKRLGRVLPPDREQALIDWIRTGGHLVVGVGDRADAGAAALREHVGVELGPGHVAPPLRPHHKHRPTRAQPRADHRAPADPIAAARRVAVAGAVG